MRLQKTSESKFMKKYLLGLLFCASTTYAMDIMMDCEHLKLVIYNNTPDNCLLVDKQLKHGLINLYSEIPLNIPSGTRAAPIIIEEDFNIITVRTNTDLSLTYRCGETRQITLQSQKAACINGSDTQAQILSASNMDATYDITPGSWWSSRPGEIIWTLY